MLKYDNSNKKTCITAMRRARKYTKINLPL